MIEFVLVAVIVVVVSVIGQIKKAQNKGQTQFKWPTPKSWQLPGPGQQPGQPMRPVQPVQPVQQTYRPGTPPPMPQVIQQLPGTWPSMPQQVVQPMPGTRPPMGQVVQPVQGYIPQQPAGWLPAPVAPPLPAQFRQPALPHHRPPQNQLPAPQGELDDRVRELMNKNMEVAAVRLLSDEAELGIIEAQEYARSLVAPQQAADSEPADPTAPSGGPASRPVDPRPVDEERYTGSAAFGTSTFEREDENVWASGWVDRPEPEDRSDIDELWKTVRDAGRPQS